MRLNILAFAAGVLVLQMQPELPAWAPWAIGGLLLALPVWRRPNWPVKGLALIGCFAIGLAWASWRAEIRLADQLDAASEGQDVEVIGVVASLPQDFSHGTRFEFDLKFGQKNGPTVAFAVPRRVMLSWYQGRRDDEQFALSLRA
jgi:competence protein ComEC